MLDKKYKATANVSLRLNEHVELVAAIGSYIAINCKYVGLTTIGRF